LVNLFELYDDARTYQRQIKNTVFWDVTPFSQMCTKISEHSAAYKICSVEGGSGMPLNVDTSLLPRYGVSKTDIVMDMAARNSRLWQWRMTDALLLLWTLSVIY